MQSVLADVRHTEMCLGQLLHGFFAVGAALLAARDHPLQALDPGQTLLQSPRIVELRPIAHLRHRRIPRSTPPPALLPALDQEFPSPPAPRQTSARPFRSPWRSGCEHHCREVAAFFQAQHPRRGSWMAFSKTWIAPVKRKLPNPFFLDLKRGKPTLTFLPACFSFTRRKKWAKAWSRSQGFLRRTLRHFIHPGQFALLQRIQFAVQVDGGWCLFPAGKGFLLASQTPDCRQSGRSSMANAGSLLSVVQVQLGLE